MRGKLEREHFFCFRIIDARGKERGVGARLVARVRLIQRDFSSRDFFVGWEKREEEANGDQTHLGIEKSQ